MSAASQNSSNADSQYRRDLHSGGFPVFSGGEESARAKYMMDVYAYAAERANEAIDWYLLNKKGKKRWAQATRLAAIGLTTLGGLVPLLAASRIPQEILRRYIDNLNVDASQMGFVFLALAAACVGLDKFFGFSSAWIRYLTTASTLQKELQGFYLDWATLSACPGDAAASGQCETKLRQIREFLMRVYGEIEKETADWAAEYRSNLAELEKSASRELEANRPGSVNVTIPNVALSPEGVTVLQDGVPLRVTTTPDCLLSPVFPGEHVITIRGTIQGKTVIATATAKVEPGKPCLLSLKLPVEP